MIASTIWKIEASFLTSATNIRNAITYRVLDSATTGVDSNSVLSYNASGFMTANRIDPNGTPSGEYISFTDTFQVLGTASGSCSVELTGGTFPGPPGTAWAGNCNVSIVLTRLS
jgi:hypothetical protein